ncbi:MAG TPA: aspartate/glutamate racemase family protein [Pyrinomonadaceae bacterium]|nr:aspartate/glutamate racemase family protein [Pyrinomonadaceae bacterium]
MKRSVAFIHTSPAAIGPLMQFYGEHAPELEITNLLDDGLLRLLASGRAEVARKRLSEMLRDAAETYEPELAMITCSSVPREMSDSLARDFRMPVLKIDYPMARAAVRAGRRVGVAATFPPTLAPTSKLLNEAAEEAGTEIEIVQEVEPKAYDALLSNDTATHDRLLLDLIERLQERDVACVVLAQVSMARVLPLVGGRARVPVLTSLHTSLGAIREAMSETSHAESA